jgi:hypothetical protein
MADGRGTAKLRGSGCFLVMAGLDPAIHVFTWHQRKTWMPATSAGMTGKMEELRFAMEWNEPPQNEKANG